ncbi:two-component sensor histidine kinase [Enterococcus florum]|uniref:histidine kinase n=1 Tax=Enterococcus florum TaxID=2480627 RepID=A0A4P5P9Q2_9ENTE|nr:HAMP domain-containing sensor histidine kinase [Enterococcus florum]GCF94825.1 two-component sensor histidine kinase [Enterococcus florum]
MLSWLLCLVLLAVVAGLVIKIGFLKKSIAELRQELTEHFAEETNTLLVTSSGDKHVRQLTAELNVQLRLLRHQRQRYLAGNQELHAAVTNISHDLRTPLTAVLGYLDLLEQEEKSETVARYLAVISNRAELLKELTEEFFRYSVVLSPEQQIDIEPIVLNQLLEESLADAYVELSGRRITPTVQLPTEKVIRKLHRAQVVRIFSNLINNAIKYSDGDLMVTLTTEGTVTFVNTAAGLNEIQAGKLLDRFYTVETGAKSTGLGLTIAKGLMEQIGGEITVNYQKPLLSIQIKFPPS